MDAVPYDWYKRYLRATRRALLMQLAEIDQQLEAAPGAAAPVPATPEAPDVALEAVATRYDRRARNRRRD